MTIRRLIRAILYSLLTILSLSLVACGLQIHRKDQGPLVKPPEIPSKIVEAEKVQVTFIVQSPATSFETFTLALDILDDLSGYKDNINRYPMQSKGENRFEVSLLLDKGFDYRYRYVIVDPSEVVETRQSGQAVDLRMMVAEKNLIINDTVVNWRSSATSLPTGTISGHLIDHKTQKGIPDLLMTIAGLHTYTDMTGFFSIENVPEGTHNLLAYAIDGSYAPLQQRANISANVNTRVETVLVPLEKVTMRFQIKSTDETVGVPIRFVGNFAGIGAHFGLDFNKTGSIAALMPLLTQVEPDRYTLELDLYAGSALRYRYSLGNGYINAERSEEGGLVTRQFIVPKHAATVKDQIVTWRADNLEPITIHVDTPIYMPPEEMVSVQILRKDWEQPIPMWHVRDQKWTYLLFSNGYDSALDLRFCRNDNCEYAWDESSFEKPVKAKFNEAEEISHQVVSWHNWTTDGTLGKQHDIPVEQTSLTGVELTQLYHPIQLPYLTQNISQLKKNGINWLILRPGWEVHERNGMPTIQLSEKYFMLYRDLAEMSKAAQESGMKVSLFPKITFPMKTEDWWQSASRDDAFWQQWYQQYDAFLNNNTVFAKTFGVDSLILGEDGLRYSLPGGLEAKGSKKGTPETAQETWQTMLDNMRKQYQGKILWATTVSAKPEKTILSQFDGFYVLVSASKDLTTFSQLDVALDTFLSDFVSDPEKDIYIGLNLPALNSEAMEYTDLMEPIIASASNGNESFLDLTMQSQLYQDLTCGLKAYHRISGVSSRGFNGAIYLTDISSSIFGKPAMDEFLNCRNISQ